MKVAQCNLRGLQIRKLVEGEWALLSMRDPLQPLPEIHPDNDITDELYLTFNDVEADAEAPHVIAPTAEHAKLIVGFIRDKKALIVQCTQGLGRSGAVVMALQEAAGVSSAELREKSVYNRRLYALLCEQLKLPAPQDPLVSMVVRVKYPVDRLHAFILCMQRQRHTNWELIAVTDGPRPDVKVFLDELDEPRVRLVETHNSLGLWGHPYRQVGIAEARGEFLGLSNDDNYYVPGYFEQMIYAIQSNDADLALCNHVHSYFGWSHFTVDVDGSTGDIGAWIARKTLIDRHQWSGIHVDYETDYLKSLLSEAKVVYVKRPLFVHN